MSCAGATSSMILLDTMVLVYATGREHAFREPCRRLVAAIGSGRLEATTTVEVVQEFMHVRARRRTRAQAASLANHFADLLSPLIAVTRDQLRHGIELFEGNADLDAFDAVLAATAIDAGASAFVSADRAFAGVGGLRHVVPDAAGVQLLLDQNAGDSV